MCKGSFILKTQVFKIMIVKYACIFHTATLTLMQCLRQLILIFWKYCTLRQEYYLCDWLCKWPRIATVPLMQEIKNKDSHETSTWTVTNILAHIKSDLIIDLKWQSQQTQSYRTLYNQLMLTTFLCTDTLWYSRRLGCLVSIYSSRSELWHKQRRQELADSVA